MLFVKKKYTVANICRFVILRFQHLLCSFVIINRDFELNVLHRTLCFLVEFSFSLYQVNVFFYLMNKIHCLKTFILTAGDGGDQNCKHKARSFPYKVTHRLSNN